MRVQSAAVFVIAMVPVMTVAQQFLPNFGPPVDPNTRFEVVAIKAFNDASGGILMRTTPGRFESSVAVGFLLRQALQKPDYQMVGAPGWMDRERYSITAKPPEGVPPAAISVLLVNLLKDRFQLATHLETREQPIYHLVLARADGRLGRDIKPTSAECQAAMAARIAAAQAAAGRVGPPPPPPPLPDPNGPVPCGFFRIPPGLAAASGFAIAALVRTLSDLTGRPVIDKTGLTGLYDFTLKYAPELGRIAGPPGFFAPSPGGAPPAVDPDAPSLSVALQEQLGLKLESSRGPMEVVIIDKLEKPTLD
jgi:bla regulator protein blaR1